MKKLFVMNEPFVMNAQVFMDFIQLIQLNQASGRWMYPQWEYHEENDSWKYTAWDTLLHSIITYTENQLQTEEGVHDNDYSPVIPKSLSTGKQYTNPDIHQIIHYELQKLLGNSIMDMLDNHRLKNINIVGVVQGGKSRVMMLLGWKIIYEKKQDLLLFVANMVNSYNQILSRDIPLFNSWLNERGEYVKLLQIKGLRGETEAPLKGHPCITLCMGNVNQMKKIKQEIGSFRIITDESDTFIKHFDPRHDRSVTGKIYDDLLKKSTQNMFVTATPFANLNRKDIESISVQMIPTEFYRGIHHEKIVRHTFSMEEKKGFLTEDDRLIKLIREAIDQCNICGQMPYSSILVNARYSMSQQKNLALQLQNEGIPSFVINSEKSKPIVFYEATGKIVNMDLRTVQHLFDFFEDTSKETYRCHVLIASKMASRAVSFRASYPRRGGLIGEILIPSDSSHGANKIQSLRICGNYDENYPLQHLWICEEDLKDIEYELMNVDALTSVNKEYGPSRLQIEGVLVHMTGKHDRIHVDDTRYYQKINQCEQVFTTKEELLRSISTEYNQYRIMTEEESLSISIPFLTIENRHSSSTQHAVHDYVTQELLSVYQKHRSSDGLTIAWDFQGDRWGDLHNMHTRFYGRNIRYCSKYVGSVNETYDKINIIIWKDGFFEKERTGNRTLGDLLEDPKTAFLYRTTENQWRFYNPFMHRKIGKLIH